MLKLVDRLVWRDLLGPLLNSVFMFLMLLFTSAYLFKITDLMVKGAPFALVAKVALYSLPSLLTQTLPMGLLLGTLLAFGRISGDSEHIALHASGVSFYRLVRPVMWVGLLVGIAAFAWNEKVVPPAMREFYRLSQNAVENVKATEQALYYTVKRKNSEEVDEFVSVEGGYDAKTKSLRKVTILKMSDNPKRRGQPEVCIYADRVVARDARGTDWTFYDCRVTSLNPERNRKVWLENHYNEITTLPGKASLGRDFRGIMQADFTDNKQMTFVQLRDKINKERAQGSLNLEVTLANEFDLWSKVSLPLASLIFGLVAAPLGIRPQRGSRTMGFGIAVGIIFLYWVVHNWMYQVAKGGTLPPLLAAFAADILGLIAAAFLVSRTRQ
jgi:lipopolysaccharide export system permease protein